MSAVVRGLMATLLSLGIAGASAAQMLTGTITGTVSDSTDSILPGVTVTVTGERLIGGPQSAVTDQQGTYRIDGLPPGDYDVAFELTGFTPVDRRGVRLSAGFVATINAELGVGTLEDRVTVTGESPVVDTRSNVQQTVMGQEILEAIPTGRDAWSLAKIIPGVAVGTYDVGGTQGMQQSAITAHGSRGDDKTFAIDGLSVNWPGNGGGGTMVYYDQGMFEETNYQTSAIPAEVSIGGVYMNMVTKAGGNTWSGDLRYYYADDGMQSENFQEVSERFDFPGGNPVVTQYDFNAGAGGPLMRDRLWLFGSFRRWRVDKEVLAVRNADGTHPLDDNLIWNGSGKLTAQLTPNHRIQGVYNYNQKDRYHRQDADAAFIESVATTLQEQPGYAAQLKYTAVLSSETLFESTIGGSGGMWPQRYQPEVGPDDLRREDTVLSTARGAGPNNFENPNDRLQFDNVVSHTRTGWGAGTHSLKAGVQFTRMFYQENIHMNGDMHLFYADGVPFRITAFNTPLSATSYVHQLGIFGQDSWNVGRLTLNVGFRADRATGWIPAQTSPAGRWVEERQLERRDVYEQWMPVWRAGAVWDLLGNGRTAVKGNYSRYGSQVGIDRVTNVHPFDLSSADIAWNDADGDDFPDLGELGAFEGFTGAATTRYADPDGHAWPYSDEITAGVEHQLAPSLRVGVMYYHRTNNDNPGSRNVAVPPEAYSPVEAPDPRGAGTLTIHNLDPAFVGLQENVRETTDLLDTTYDGVEITAQKRLSDRWQMLFGFTAGQNEGGLVIDDFNDPNLLINQQGVVENDATYSLKLSGTYVVPKLEMSVHGSFVRDTGYPRQFMYQVTQAALPGLTRSSQVVAVNRRGDERLPSVTLLDLRVTRPFELGGIRFEPQLDIFNATNQDAIVGMVETIGARFGYPTEILAPRIIRVGLALQF